MAATKRPVLFHWKKVDPMPKKNVPARTSKEAQRKKDHERENGACESSLVKQVAKKGASTVDVQHKLKGNATLRDLCTQDKQRVRQLVEQLATIEEQKERLEAQIQSDRLQFTELLEKLKEEHKKVIAEKRQVVEELHSSQLQLQQVHTYPTLPEQVPLLVRSHNSHMTPSSSLIANTVTVDSSHMTPLPQNPHTVSSSTATGVPLNHPNNYRGVRKSPPRSDNYTPSVSSPQEASFVSPKAPPPSTVPSSIQPLLPITSSVCHMSSNTSQIQKVIDHVPGHVTTTTAHTSAVSSHMIPPFVHVRTTPTVQAVSTAKPHPLPLAPSTILHPSIEQKNKNTPGTHDASVQTQSTCSAATQTERSSPNSFTVSDLVTIETNSETPKTPPHHLLEVKGHPAPSMDTVHPQHLTLCSAYHAKGGEKKEKLIRSQSSYSEHCKVSPAPHNVSNRLDNSALNNSNLPRPPSPGNVSTQAQSLLATALQNAHQTLEAIQILSSSVEQERLLSSSLVNGGESLAGGHGDRHRTDLGTEKTPRADSHSKSHSGVEQQSTVLYGHDRTYLSSPECELVLSLNCQSSTAHGKTLFQCSDMEQNEALTSTPFLSRGTMPQKLESKLGSTIADSEDEVVLVSDILEHAQSLSRKLRSDNNVSAHAQSLLRTLQEPTLEDSSSTHEDIVEELFFI